MVSHKNVTLLAYPMMHFHKGIKQQHILILIRLAPILNVYFDIIIVKYLEPMVGRVAI